MSERNYINPKNESKEAFLAREAKEISRDDFLAFSFAGSEKTVLCLVENVMFSACVVAYSREDAVHYAGIIDKRKKKYYLIDRKKLDKSVVRDYED